MSHSSTIKLLDTLGDGYDVKVLQWKNDLQTPSLMVLIINEHAVTVANYNTVIATELQGTILVDI